MESGEGEDRLSIDSSHINSLRETAWFGLFSGLRREAVKVLLFILWFLGSFERFFREIEEGRAAQCHTAKLWDVAPPMF